MTAYVNATAKTTGTDPVPESKQGRDYVFVKDKFKHARSTPFPSKVVTSPGIKECPVVMEATVEAVHDMFRDKAVEGLIVAINVRVQRVNIHRELRLEGHRNRIDADKWKPLIMSFCRFYGLSSRKLIHSRLAEIEEEMYRPFTETTGEVEDQVDEVAEHVV